MSDFEGDYKRRPTSPFGTAAKPAVPKPASGDYTIKSAALKAGKPWELSFTGVQDGVTFHLQLSRLSDGRLTGQYRVEGGRARPWPLLGSVREDGSFRLWGIDNSAVFEGTYGADNALHIEKFHLNRTNFQIEDLDLKPEGTTGLQTAKATDKTKVVRQVPSTVPKADGQAWAGPKTFEGTDAQGVHFALKLSRDGLGMLEGSYQANGGEWWALRGTLYRDGHLEARGTNGARFTGQVDQAGTGLALRVHFHHLVTGYMGDLTLGQRVHGASPLPPRPDMKSNTTGLKQQSQDKAPRVSKLSDLSQKYPDTSFVVRRSASGVASKLERQRAFNIVIAAARDCGEPFPEVLAAQWALESSWGRIESGKNNLFGIKARRGEPSTEVVTHEEDSRGQRERTTARFRDYDSVVEGVMARVELTRRNPVYAQHGYFTATTSRQAVQALKAAGYATDGGYVQLIVGVLKSMGCDVDKPVVVRQAVRPPSPGVEIDTLPKQKSVAPKNNNLSTLMSKETLSVEEVAEARLLIERIDDVQSRGDIYLQLQGKIPYHNQRNNASTERGKDLGDAMCNLTSLAMALETLGIDNPEPEHFPQFEDFLEALRVRRELPARTAMDGWGGVAKAMGAHYQLVGGDVVTGHTGQYGAAWWHKHILPELRQGKAVTMSITGHIVRVQGVEEEGLVVDDPYGISRLDAGKKRGWRKTNRNTGPESDEMVGAVGNDALWNWQEVAQHTMHWIAVFSKR